MNSTQRHMHTKTVQKVIHCWQDFFNVYLSSGTAFPTAQIQLYKKNERKKKQWKGRRRWTLTNNHILWKLCMYKHEAKKQQTTCFHPQWSTVEPLHPVGESECRPDFSLLRSLKTSTSARSTGSGHAVLITVACGTVIRMMAAHDESNKQWEGWK